MLHVLLYPGMIYLESCSITTVLDWFVSWEQNIRRDKEEKIRDHQENRKFFAEFWDTANFFTGNRDPAPCWAPSNVVIFQTTEPINLEIFTVDAANI